MGWTPLESRLDRLPLLLAGPILRRVDPGIDSDGSSVSVWLVLKERKDDIQLSVFNPETKARILWSDITKTKVVTLGPHLHMTCVTADKSEGSKLQAGKLYTYDIGFGDGQTLKDALARPGASEDTMHQVSYGEIGAPSFVLPPADRSNLRLAQGS